MRTFIKLSHQHHPRLGAVLGVLRVDKDGVDLYTSDDRSDQFFIICISLHTTQTGDREGNGEDSAMYDHVVRISIITRP